MTILLLGRPDAPTDGVADYAGRLAAALRARGRDAHLARVQWERDGWSRAVRVLRRDAKGWRGEWVVLQYTALQWSRRGFPWRVPSVIRALRRAGCRVAVIMHDPDLFPRRDGVDALRQATDVARRFVQRRAMRFMMQHADRVVHTTGSDETLLGASRGSARVIPVGSNVDIPVMRTAPAADRAISVFGVSGEPRGTAELQEMAAVIRHVLRAVGSVRVELCGRNSEAAGSVLRGLVVESGAEIVAHGVVSAAEAGRIIADSTVTILMRGQATSGRGSLSAAIACGVPAVAWKGSRTAPPLTEAGIVIVPSGDVEAFGAAVTRILNDPAYAAALRAKQAEAQRLAFSWDAIAMRFDEALGND